MYLPTDDIQFIYAIREHSGPPAKISILFKDPDGISEFDTDGASSTAVYALPTIATEGSYKFSKMLNKVGTWNVSLCTGDHDNYTIIETDSISIRKPEVAEAAYHATVNLK